MRMRELFNIVRPSQNNKSRLVAYLLWLPFFGILGLHNIYLSVGESKSGKLRMIVHYLLLVYAIFGDIVGDAHSAATAFGIVVILSFIDLITMIFIKK